MRFDTDVSFQPRGKIFLLQKSIALKGHYDSMFWVETTFPKIDFLLGGVCQKNVHWLENFQHQLYEMMFQNSTQGMM